LLLGRAPEADILIQDRSISREHARLEVARDGRLAITDLGSANGTTLRTLRLVAHERTPLQLGEALMLGKAMVVVHEEAVAVANVHALDRATFEKRLADQVRDAEGTDLPFALAAIDSRVPITAEHMLAATSHLLTGADALGHDGTSIWYAIIDDTPLGRAGRTIARLREALRAEQHEARFGFARWTQGRSSDELLDTARAEISDAQPALAASPNQAVASEGPTEVMRPLDRQAIMDALATSGGNQAVAAGLLGIHRRTLMRWMDTLGIVRPRKGTGAR
jgi:hypothetical protein